MPVNFKVSPCFILMKEAWDATLFHLLRGRREKKKTTVRNKRAGAPARFKMK